MEKKRVILVINETIIQNIRQAPLATSWSNEDRKMDSTNAQILAKLHLHQNMITFIIKLIYFLFSSSNSSFSPPPIDFVKLYFDDTSKWNQGIVGFGGVFWDWNVTTLQVFAHS